MRDGAEKQNILELEKRRCAALTSGDIKALSALISDDLIHIHGSGQIEGKIDYLKGVETKFIFHRIARGDLDVRIYSEVAVVVGRLEQTIQLRGEEKRHDIQGLASQTWVKDGDGWKQNSCHMHFLNVT